jgi:hypothetical protein
MFCIIFSFLPKISLLTYLENYHSFHLLTRGILSYITSSNILTWYNLIQNLPLLTTNPAVNDIMFDFKILQSH